MPPTSEDSTNGRKISAGKYRGRAGNRRFPDGKRNSAGKLIKINP